jgi:hypothetical protein
VFLSGNEDYGVNIFKKFSNKKDKLTFKRLWTLKTTEFSLTARHPPLDRTLRNTRIDFNLYHPFDAFIFLILAPLKIQIFHKYT